jgi:hypothetical protein
MLAARAGTWCDASMMRGGSEAAPSRPREPQKLDPTFPVRPTGAWHDFLERAHDLWNQAPDRNPIRSRHASSSTLRIAAVMLSCFNSIGMGTSCLERFRSALATDGAMCAGSWIAITWSMAETCFSLVSILLASSSAPPSRSARFLFSSFRLSRCPIPEMELETTRRAGSSPVAFATECQFGP